MNCIISNKTANATGSHLVPASLIKNCVGKHYGEESYEIDSKNSSINVFFGRDNLKNTSTEIKQNHYKRDYILSQDCEDKLGVLENEISVKFLQKFRKDKYSNNFKSLILENGFEIIIPKKLTNRTLLAYFYSIILRECHVLEVEDNIQILSKSETENIRKFVFGYLYDENNDDAIKDYKLVITFDKYCEKGSYVATSNEFKNPYLFYFCEAIIQLYTNEPDERAKFLFGETFNDTSLMNSKIIVGPQELYDTLRTKMADKLADDFLTKGVMKLCSLNQRNYEENLNELLQLSDERTDKMIALNELIKKYGG